MKRKLFSLLILLFLGVNGFGQVEIEWQKCLGGTYTEEAYSIQKTTDGGYVVAGRTSSNDGDVSGNHGGYDIWVVKLDAVGNLQWQKCLGGTDWDWAYSVYVTSDGGYVVAGRTWSTNGDVFGNHGGYDIWVVKLDAVGNLQWQKCLGGTDDDRAYSIQQTSDGGYVVAGETDSNSGDVSGNHGLNDYWVVKLDAGGNLQWQKCFGGADDDRAYSIQQTSDGGYVVAGHTESNNGDVSGNHGGGDYWVVKLDAVGNILWQKCLGGAALDKACSIQQTSDGGYVVAGETVSNDGDVSGNHGNSDFWVVRLDAVGNILWQKCLGGTSFEDALSIQQTSDGGYVVAGQATSIDGNVSGNHGLNDYWVVKLDSLGNLQWQKCFGGTGNDYANSIQETSDGGYVVNGHSNSYNVDVSGNSVYQGYWVVKLLVPNISGIVFQDQNNNGIKDPGEQGVAGQLVRFDPGSIYTFSDNDGQFSYLGDTSITNTIEYLPQLYWYETTGNYQYNVLLDSLSQRVDTLDYGIKCRLNVNDISVYITGASTRVNFDTHYWLTYKNWGTVTANGTIEFQYDPLLTYLASTPLLPISHVGNTLTFAYNTLGPGEQRMMRLDFQVPGVQYLGDTLHSYAMINPLVPDTFITNNYDTLDQVISNSNPPSFISVRPKGLGSDGYVLHGERLTYTIRFQNTGTDTALTIVIRDFLDADLDIETFVVEAYSHPITWQLHNSSLLIFTFQNILLPDSNVNEPGCHGFIRYSISPKPGLADFTQVYNSATITFDSNPAQGTGTVNITYVSTLTEIATVTAAETVKAWPNPSSQTIYINLPEFTRKIEVYNTSGEKVKELVPQRDVAEIDVKDLPAGLYVVRMYSSKGVVSTKFIKE